MFFCQLQLTLVFSFSSLKDITWDCSRSSHRKEMTNLLLCESSILFRERRQNHALVFKLWRTHFWSLTTSVSIKIQWGSFETRTLTVLKDYRFLTEIWNSGVWNNSTDALGCVYHVSQDVNCRKVTFCIFDSSAVWENDVLSDASLIISSSKSCHEDISFQLLLRYWTSVSCP